MRDLIMIILCGFAIVIICSLIFPEATGIGDTTIMIIATILAPIIWCIISTFGDKEDKG